MKLTKRVKARSEQTTQRRIVLGASFEQWKFRPSERTLIYSALGIAFTVGFIVRRVSVNWRKLPQTCLRFAFPPLNLLHFH